MAITEMMIASASMETESGTARSFLLGVLVLDGVVLFGGERGLDRAKLGDGEVDALLDGCVEARERGLGVLLKTAHEGGLKIGRDLLCAHVVLSVVVPHVPVALHTGFARLRGA